MIIANGLTVNLLHRKINTKKRGVCLFFVYSAEIFIYFLHLLDENAVMIYHYTV